PGAMSRPASAPNPPQRDPENALAPPPPLEALRPPLRESIERALAGERLGRGEALALADAQGAELPALWAAAAWLRDQGHPPEVTCSRKVFIPLTNLCRVVCSY